jgi:hypothetical protein
MVLMRRQNENIQSRLHFPAELKMKSWVNGRTVLIGDAAHSIMPNLPWVMASLFGDKSPELMF